MILSGSDYAEIGGGQYNKISIMEVSEVASLTK